MLGDFARQFLDLAVGNLFVVDKNSKLAAGLNGVGLFDAGKAFGDFFQVFKAVNIVVNRFLARSRTGRAYRVGDLNDNRFKACRLNVVVVRADGVDHSRRLAHLSRGLRSDFGVVLVAVSLGALADVVQNGRALGKLAVGAQFGGQKARDFGDFL